jgi:antitoxin MazE
VGKGSEENYPIHPEWIYDIKCISIKGRWGGKMKLAKWGNSVGVRIPAAMVKSANLKVGDPIHLQFRDDQVLEISRDLERLRALEAIKKLARPLPEGYRFNREEANER